MIAAFRRLIRILLCPDCWAVLRSSDLAHIESADATWKAECEEFGCHGQETDEP